LHSGANFVRQYASLHLFHITELTTSPV
jgi:hypothetical protein